MKYELENSGFSQEQKPAFVIENNIIESITNLEALGVYTYMKMLIEQDLTKVTDISEKVCKHFSISEKQFLHNMTLLNDLGFMMVIKNNN